MRVRSDVAEITLRFHQLGTGRVQCYCTVEDHEGQVSWAFDGSFGEYSTRIELITWIVRRLSLSRLLDC